MCFILYASCIELFSLSSLPLIPPHLRLRVWAFTASSQLFRCYSVALLLSYSFSCPCASIHAFHCYSDFSFALSPTTTTTLNLPPLHYAVSFSFDATTCPEDPASCSVLLLTSTLLSRRLSSLLPSTPSPLPPNTSSRCIPTTMSSPLKKTALHSFHLAQQAKMEAFAGYHMPISYGKLGVLKEHLYTRQVAGIFDVSHMGQYEVRSTDREKFMEYVTPVDLQRTQVGQGTLTLLTNAQGGIKDDCIVTKMDDHLLLVLNAGCKDKDVAHMEEVLHEGAMKGADVRLVPLERSLIALQGPQAAAILSEFMDGVPDMDFMHCRQKVKIKGMEVQVTRCGYTGEDGFEIAASDRDVATLVELLLSRKAELIGLGARDSLRLEAGLGLYGHEMTEDINPVAARLMWTISKRRMEEGGFIGYEAIKNFRDNASKGAVPRLRVGLVSTGPVAREKTVIEVDGKQVGEVTSGCPSPCLKKNIALGYVDRGLAAKGVKVDLVVRGRRVPAEVVTPPFVPAHYYRKPK